MSVSEIKGAAAKQGRGAAWFGWTYPLASLAAHIAFIPFFALLLPRKIEALAGSGNLTVLSWILVWGAVVASLAHIGAGHVGDRWLARFGSRRGLIALGLAMLALCYAWLAVAGSTASMAAAVMAFQVALNVMFAPLGALLADYVPDERKGAFAGWVNGALPLASIFTAILTALYPSNNDAAFWVTLAALLAFCFPLLVFWPHGKPLIARPPRAERSKLPASVIQQDYFTAWIARFFIQFGAAIMLGYLFAYLTLHGGRDGFPSTASAAIGVLSVVAATAGLFAAIAAGHISDLAKRRLHPIAMGGAVASASLAAIAWSDTWAVFAFAYATFHLGLTAFLTVDTALVAQLLRGHQKRGLYLGVMNLTNTVPAILGPVLTLAALGELSDANALKTIISLAAFLALAASLLILGVRSIR